MVTVVDVSSVYVGCTYSMALLCSSCIMMCLFKFARYGQSIVVTNDNLKHFMSGYDK